VRLPLPVRLFVLQARVLLESAVEEVNLAPDPVASTPMDI
jgi:hypothetical protein